MMRRASFAGTFRPIWSGDPTPPVFLPEYAAFFGPKVAIQAKGGRTADGALRLDSLSVQANALSLQGSMALAANGQPDVINFSGTLGLSDGPVTLPIAAAQPIKLGHADLSLTYDKKAAARSGHSAPRSSKSSTAAA